MIKIINESIEDDFDNFDFGNNEADWIVGIPKECIKGATLLSEEEYVKYRDNIPETNHCWWWLRSAGSYSHFAYGVYTDGDIDDDYYVSNTNGGIRPALILDLQSFNFEVGNKFEFGEHLFTIISSGLAICDEFICKGCFRKDLYEPGANDYEKSDVKKVIDNWFNNAMRSE